MVTYLTLGGGPGNRGLMFVSYYGRSRAFISNYRSWKEYYSSGNIVQMVSSLLSHETLHLTINKFSLIASAELDNLFGKSNDWHQYPHGLGDLDKLSVNSGGVRKAGAKKSQKLMRKKRRTRF
jgi:hypothetical protein